jgi:uridine kinase
MKEIEQIVTDYLKAENTDYAILINGDWGSGKTHYIKNTLFNKISAIDSFYTDKKNNTEKYKPLYVSLYGMT